MGRWSITIITLLGFQKFRGVSFDFQLETLFKAVPGVLPVASVDHIPLAFRISRTINLTDSRLVPSRVQRENGKTGRAIVIIPCILMKEGC